MNDLEQRLRAAMTATAEPAPSGLMEGIRRRHHRHRRRFMAGSAAAVAAVGLAVLPAVLPRAAGPAFSTARNPSHMSAEAGAAARPWWETTGVSSCGVPAVVRFGGHVRSVGDCAGSLVVPALKVTLHVGQQIDVHMTEEPRGPDGNQLVPVIPLPSSSSPSVVLNAPVTVGQATGTYRAVRPGQAVLASHTGFCMEPSGEKTGNCPVVQITVVP